MLYNFSTLIYKFWYNFNHSIITAVLVTVGCIFGYGLDTLLVVGGFWFGREHAQAEYRFMKIQGITREDLGFLQGFNPIAWNKDSFIVDLIIPIIIGVLVILIYKVF
jgi:hypothetical protein